MDESASPVLFDKMSAHVAVVTLNRPDKRNAGSPELADAMEAASKQPKADLDVRAVVLESCDPRVFCGETFAARSSLTVQDPLQAAQASAAQPDGPERMIVAERIAALRRTDDLAEGPRAFLKKRAPVWTGR